MNDEQLKELLATELFKAPSSNFNHLVLSALSVKEKKGKGYFIPLDEPLIIGLSILSMLVMSILLLYGNPKKVDNVSAHPEIYLIGLLFSFIPIFIIAMNTITKKIMLHRASHS